MNLKRLKNDIQIELHQVKTSHTAYLCDNIGVSSFFCAFCVTTAIFDHCQNPQPNVKMTVPISHPDN